MEKPIVTTDLDFALNICGKAALYFSPKDAIDAADQIQKLLDDGRLRRELVQHGKNELRKFDTPLQRAEKYLKICEEVSQKNKGWETSF